MADRQRVCGGNGTDKACTFRGEQKKELEYWCANCERVVAEKRCPLCGLKARKIRSRG